MHFPHLLLPLTIKLLLLFLLHSTTTTLTTAATPPQPFLNAAETLSNSGYNAMSLTLSSILTDPTISLHKSPSRPTLTIFTPPDSAFESSGQPSLSQLLLHFSPLSLSLPSLASLPFGTTIPTLSPSAASLVVTSVKGSSKISINNAKVLGSPVYDDGSVVVFAIDDFFTNNFTIHQSPQQNPPGSALECSDTSSFSTLAEASSKLKSRGFSIMASFLELQMMGYMKLSPWPLKLTMFAPEDEVLLHLSGDITSYSALLMRHTMSCKLSYADLNGVANGSVFRENFEGLSFVIERTDRELFVNGVEITFPDLYYSDWFVIHGIRDEISEQIGDGFQDEEIEEDGDEEVSSVSYDEAALGPGGNEL